MDKTKQQTGVFDLTRTLNLGSSGDDVKTLQTYLAGLGITGQDGLPIKPDGIYGPNTKYAVMQFQKQNNLVSDGIAGPKTGAMISQLQGTDFQSGTAGNTSLRNKPIGVSDADWLSATEAERASLIGMYNVLQQDISNGYMINPNIIIDEKIAARYMKQAKNKLAPVYQEQIDDELQQLRQNIDENKQGYELETRESELKYRDALEGNRSQWAQAGLASSGRRARTELEMMEQQNANRSFADLQFQNKQADLARAAQRQVGYQNMGGFKMPKLTTNTANLEGYGGDFTYGGRVPTSYDTRQFRYGKLPTEEERERQKLADSYRTQGNIRLTQGRQPLEYK